jgi:hypothetical protein
VANRPVDGRRLGAGLQVGDDRAGMGVTVAHGSPPWRRGPGGADAGGDARSGSAGSARWESAPAKGRLRHRMMGPVDSMTVRMPGQDV